MKGNIEEVTTFFCSDGGDATDWLHRDDAPGMVIVNHRLTDCVSAVFNFVNTIFILTRQDENAEIIAGYCFLWLSTAALLNDEVSVTLSTPQFIPESILDTIR